MITSYENEHEADRNCKNEKKKSQKLYIMKLNTSTPKNYYWSETEEKNATIF